jgi:phage FluMu protein Com
LRQKQEEKELDDMPTEKDNDPKIAVRCENCKKILAFKLGTASGFLQLKCPVCKTEIKVDLSLRRGRIYNRKSSAPLTITFL